jgi:ABC-2 type transport system ATP-binding protein
MADIAALTPRLLLIDGGRLRFDGPMAGLSRTLAPERQVRVRGERATLLPALGPLGFHDEADGMRADVPMARVNELLGAVLARLPDADVRVEDVPLEEVLRRAFRGEATPPA